MKIPVFDLHCDTAGALLGESCRECGSLLRNSYHIDLERAKTLPGYAQCFACFTTTPEAEYCPVSPEERFEREMETVFREVSRNDKLISVAYSASQIEENRKNGIMSAILTIEGTAGIGFDPELLPDLYRVGFRITTLGWNEKNPLTGSNKTGEGLTEAGKRYVRKAQEQGMIVDVSHISDRGFWDIMDMTSAPVIATHSDSRAVCDVSRNLTDEMFLAICRTEGVAGINLYPEFVGGDRSLDAVCDHIFHFLSLDPDGKHIALGGDLDGIECMPTGFTGVQDYPLLAERLARRGLDENMIFDIFWNNAIGVIDRCCM